MKKMEDVHTKYENPRLSVDNCSVASTPSIAFGSFSTMPYTDNLSRKSSVSAEIPAARRNLIVLIILVSAFLILGGIGAIIAVIITNKEVNKFPESSLATQTNVVLDHGIPSSSVTHSTFETTSVRESTFTSPYTPSIDGIPEYIPNQYTYPNKCDTFIRYVFGVPVNQTCSECLYFTLDEMVCDWYWSPHTYCARRAAENGHFSNILLPRCTSFNSNNSTRITSDTFIMIILVSLQICYSLLNT